MKLRIENFNKLNHTNIWDDFVLNKSINGTIYHTFKFISYHKEDEFLDNSFLIYNQDELVSVILLADYKGELISHPGTVGGGPVFHSKLYGTEIKKILDFLYFKLKDNQVFIRVNESVFFNNNDNSFVVHFLSNFYKCYRELSYYFSLRDTNDFLKNIKRKRIKEGVRSELNKGFNVEILERKSDYIEFYKILTDNLIKHNVKPVHTLNEFLDLKTILGVSQALYVVKNNNMIVAGIWVIKANNNCWQAQYIAKDYINSKNYTLHTLHIEIAKIAKSQNVKYFNLGICTENNGNILNKGLANFKESLGTVAIERFIFSNNNFE